MGLNTDAASPRPGGTRSVRRCFPELTIIGSLAILVLIGGNLPWAGAANFQDLRRVPDQVVVITESQNLPLTNDGNGAWSGGGIQLTTQFDRGALPIRLTATNVALKHLEIRWQVNLPHDWKYLGDAWERAYGDLEWRGFSPERIMPWYFLVSDGVATHGYGVKTGPAAICHWAVTPDTVVLHADIRSGGVGVQLENRTLAVCEVVCRESKPGESPFRAAQEFCRLMCPHPRLPQQPVYGFNDWYCAYGANTADAFLETAAYLTRLAPTNNRPFALVDDGWQVKAERGDFPPWSRTNPRFSTNLTMAQFAQRVRDLGARPGIWVRPLQSYPDQPAHWRLARNPKVLDPTVPEVRDYVRNTIQRLRDWRYDLIKHDFTTFELLGLWGKDMTNQVTWDGWAFAQRNQTTAEIIHDLYREIRKAAGDETIIIGCNTIGHLAAGIFELQRVGDDTSGREWSRTLKMGVNCLGFRAPQHETFFAIDADCVGQSATGSDISWEKNRQWLELLAQSGTPCFVSFPRELVTPDREPDVRRALQAAAEWRPVVQPVDWMKSLQPREWLLDGRTATFNW